MSTSQIESTVNEAERLVQPTMPDGHEITITNGVLMALIEAAKDDRRDRYVSRLESAIKSALCELDGVVD